MRLLSVTMMLTLVMGLFTANAQSYCTLEQCRELAIKNNKELAASGESVEMALEDTRIARANYMPNISAIGGYLYNSRNLDLIGERREQMLTNLGTSLQDKIAEKVTALLSNPAMLPELQKSPLLQALFAQINTTDIATPLNAIGKDISDAFHVDVENIFVAGVSLQQPLYMGGKIVNANKMAKLAYELSQSQYDTQYQEIIVQVDEAFWQIVSIEHKLELANSYSKLMHSMENDVKIMVDEGVATEADALSVQVKANEADMMVVKASNGLTLSKMLLCKICGLPLDTDIKVASQDDLEALIGNVSSSEAPVMKHGEDVVEARPELESLRKATAIYEKKVQMIKADMMPHVALMGNYFASNPSSFNGYQKDFKGMFSVGAMVTVPIFHGGEQMHKLKKAKAEARKTEYQLQDATDKVLLQVTQLQKQCEENLKKVAMTESNREKAAENLRNANFGYMNGVMTLNTVFGAQTAWLQANTEYIDAAIELHLTYSNLKKAQGDYLKER